MFPKLWGVWLPLCVSIDAAPSRLPDSSLVWTVHKVCCTWGSRTWLTPHSYSQHTGCLQGCCFGWGTGRVLALGKSEQGAYCPANRQSLFQLTMCFQNLDQVYWPPLRSGMRQLIPNPVVITLSMWTSPAGTMAFEKSWKYWCKTKVSEWNVVVFFGFIEISYGGEILKYFNECIGTDHAGSSLSWTCIFTCCCVKWTWSFVRMYDFVQYRHGRLRCVCCLIQMYHCILACICGNRLRHCIGRFFSKVKLRSAFRIISPVTLDPLYNEWRKWNISR